jgi:hypothetical protein
VAGSAMRDSRVPSGSTSSTGRSTSLSRPGTCSDSEQSVAPGLLTWSEIWCDVENLKSFRSSRDRRIFAGHRLKGASALHNFLASIFTAPSVTTWSDMSGNTRKNQVTRLVTLRHRSIMSGALGPGNSGRPAATPQMRACPAAGGPPAAHRSPAARSPRLRRPLDLLLSSSIWRLESDAAGSSAAIIAAARSCVPA